MSLPQTSPQQIPDSEPPDSPDTPEVPVLNAPYMSRAQERLVAVGEILLCSSVPTQVAIGALLPLFGLTPIDGASGLSLPFVVALSFIDTLVLIGLMVLITRAHRERVADLWFGPRPIGRESLFGTALIPLVFVAVVISLNLLRLSAPWLHNVESNPLEKLATTPREAAVFALVAIFAGGMREELQRAFLLRRFEKHLGGAAVGVIVLSLAFGFGHIVQGWDAVVTTAALGAFWAVVYLRRGSAIAPVVSHAGFNTLEILRVAIMGT
jgi:membrane protease YdiL (CAAX protease family)